MFSSCCAKIRASDKDLTVRKWPADQGPELPPKPKFLAATKGHLSATFGTNNSEFFDLCLHWESVVHDTAQ